jgi:hypothetical protein
LKSDDISFCLSLIGKPWVSGACGPDAFDCWGLLRHVLNHRRGFALPQYQGIDEIGPEGMMKTAEAEALRWERLATPEHFACVAMARNARISHVGLWLDEAGGGVFHSFRGGGVVFQSIATVRQNGMQNFRYYKFRP